MTKDCFTQRFPLERLVYLSPDAPEVASEWRHDDVYIVGGVVDKGGGDKMTLSKIKKMGIRSQRFDIDRYFTKKKVTLDDIQWMSSYLDPSSFCLDEISFRRDYKSCRVGVVVDVVRRANFAII